MGPEQETRPLLQTLSDMKAISSWRRGEMMVCLSYDLKSLWWILLHSLPFVFFVCVCVCVYVRCICAGIASEDISITWTLFRNQLERLLHLCVELELRRVHHLSLSSAEHFNSGGRSPGSDMNTGSRRKQEDFVQRAIDAARRTSAVNRDEPWCSGADRGFHCFGRLCFCQFCLFSAENNDSQKPFGTGGGEGFLGEQASALVCIERTFRWSCLEK